jgi:1-deoxy-D-xylulose-5-phosphate synthase
VALQELPVVFAIDRGGLVGDDGATHHGVFDIAYLRTVPNLTVMAPMDEQELVDMLHTALRIDGPVAFRYPRGSGPGAADLRAPSPIEIGVAEVLEPGERVALVGYGYGALVAREAAGLVGEAIGSGPTVVNARFAKPVDGALMRELAATHDLIVTVEDHSVHGGFGSAVMEAVAAAPAPVLALGVPDRFVHHGKRELLLNEVGLTPEAVAARAIRCLTSGTLAGVPRV